MLPDRINCDLRILLNESRRNGKDIELYLSTYIDFTVQKDKVGIILRQWGSS